MSRARVRVAVIGAGVSGLTAAYRLRQRFGDDADVVVYDEADRPGGLLRTVSVGGAMMDVGAEAFIVRRPEARDLVAELGLADRVVSPGGLRPAIWSSGRLHDLPSPAMMGIPAVPDAVATVASAEDLARISGEPSRPLHWIPGDDPSVGDLVADRFGPSIVARSVDPMLGGVYSALARQLGLREAVPALAAALDRGASSLTEAVGSVVRAGAGSSGPVFGALVGGYRELVSALIEGARADLRLETEVTEVSRSGGGFDIGFNGRSAERADAVVIAVPVWTAARLLGESSPTAAEAFGEVTAAGSAVVAVAVPAEAPLPEHSGVLVATDSSDLSIKAVTLSTQKWPHLRAGSVRTLRTSFGRLGTPVTATDAELVAAATADLATVFGAAGAPAPEVVDAAVQRWPGGLPHYGPGHLERMAEALTELPSGIAVAGSGYAGVGVPACIGRADAAVGEITAHLGA